LSPITTDRLIDLLREYASHSGRRVDLLLVGGLALQAYGYRDRATQDVDAEVSGDVESLASFLRERGVPADLGENMSGWSVVAMPPGYRERASTWLDQPDLRLRLLHPVDFVVAKLRRGTDLDLADAEFVASRFSLTADAIRQAAETAIAASPQDTMLFLFRQLVDIFCKTQKRK
jgi:hypothetical protein